MCSLTLSMLLVITNVFSVASAAGTRVKGGGILRREREGRGVIFGDSI